MDFNLSQILDSNVLLEGRKEDAIKKYGEEHIDLVNLLSNVDPSGNNKYLNWMLKTALGENKDEEIPTADTVARVVSDFHRNLQRIKNKDINSYNTLMDLKNVVDEALATEKEKRVSKEAVKIYEDDKIVVMAPFTVEASCKYGSGSKWCIAQTNSSNNTNPHFDDYSKHSNFYFFINKEMTAAGGGGYHYKYALQWRFDNSSKQMTWWDAQDNSSNERPNWVTDEMMDAVIAYNPKYTKKKLDTQIVSFIENPKIETYTKFREFLTDEQKINSINKIISSGNLTSTSFKTLSADLNEKQINDFITKYVVGNVSVSDYENMKSNLNTKQKENLIIHNPQILNNFNVMKDLNDNVFDDEIKYRISNKVDNKSINNTDSKVLMKKWSMTPEQITKHNETSFYVFLSSDKDDNFFTNDGLVKVDPLNPESYRVINMMKLKKQVQPNTNMYGVKTKHGLLDEYLNKNNINDMEKEILDMIKEKSIAIG